MRKVKNELVAEVIAQEIEQYINVTMSDIEEIVEKHGNELKERIKRDSPVNTGEYKKGWRVKKEGFGTGKPKCIVYNAKKGNITHLLEFGHAKKSGGRTRAFPHIAKNEKDVQEEFEKEMVELLNGN